MRSKKQNLRRGAATYEILNTFFAIHELFYPHRCSDLLYNENKYSNMCSCQLDLIWLSGFEMLKMLPQMQMKPLWDTGDLPQRGFKKISQ